MALAVEVEIENSGAVLEESAARESLAKGVVVPMPTLPSLVILIFSEIAVLTFLVEKDKLTESPVAFSMSAETLAPVPRT